MSRQKSASKQHQKKKSRIKLKKNSVQTNFKLLCFCVAPRASYSSWASLGLYNFRYTTYGYGKSSESHAIVPKTLPPIPQYRKRIVSPPHPHIHTRLHRSDFIFMAPCIWFRLNLFLDFYERYQTLFRCFLVLSRSVSHTEWARFARFAIVISVGRALPHRSSSRTSHPAGAIFFRRTIGKHIVHTFRVVPLPFCTLAISWHYFAPAAKI